MTQKGGTKLEFIKKLLKGGSKLDMGKYWKEIIRFALYTGIMIVFDIICGRFRSHSDGDGMF